MPAVSTNRPVSGSSVDGGQTWLPSSDGMDSGDQVSGSITCRRDWVMGLARSLSQPEVFFALTPFAVYRSADGAKTWRKLPRRTGGHAVAVHPSDRNQVFLAVRDGRVEPALTEERPGATSARVCGLGASTLRPYTSSPSLGLMARRRWSRVLTGDLRIRSFLSPSTRPSPIRSTPAPHGTLSTQTLRGDQPLSFNQPPTE